MQLYSERGSGRQVSTVLQQRAGPGGQRPVRPVPAERHRAADRPGPDQVSSQPIKEFKISICHKTCKRANKNGKSLNSALKSE